MCFLGTLIHCKFLTISTCRFAIFADIIQKLLTRKRTDQASKKRST